MKRHFFFKAFVLALLLESAFVNRVYAQYQSFFGDSITEYSIGTSACTYIDEYDPYFFSVFTREYQYIPDDTVTINGTRYYYIPWTTEKFYLREDTLTGRLYRYDPIRLQDILICDMSLNVGDSFPLPYKETGDSTSPIYVVVDSIWFVNNRKYILFDEGDDFPYMTFWRPVPIIFIEGVGPTYSPMGWISEPCAACPGATIEHPGWYPLLLCAHKDGELVYMTDERAGCWQTLPFDKISEQEQNSFKLYPNPAKRIINFELIDAQSGGDLYISDLWGRVLYHERINSSTIPVNVKDYSAGVYLVTYFYDNKKTTLKFIKK